MRKVLTLCVRCNVLMNNEMHNSHNKFSIPQFFCLLYMFRKNLDVHIDYILSKHVEQTKKYWNKKLIMRIVHLFGH
jgi:hypothetical protein